MLFLVYEELWAHNQAVVHLHALIAPLLAFHKGALSFSKILGKALNAFTKNKIPSQWACYFPKPLGECQSLVSAVKIIKLRLDMYLSILKAGSVPQSLHPMLFSNPDGVMSRLANCYAISCQVERSNVVVQAEVIYRLFSILLCCFDYVKFGCAHLISCPGQPLYCIILGVL